MTALAPSLSFFLLLASQHSIANQDLSPYNLKVSVESVGSKFIIDASYMASVSQCEAYMFLTDYEDIKLSPGMIESKVRKRDGNKVVVERLVEESVLLFPLKMHSVLEYTELPNRGLNFVQTKGDSKSFSGNWRLQTDYQGVQVRYHGVLEPNSLVPKGVIEYFMKNNIQKNFENIARGMEVNKEALNLACR
ncbi:MAG: hypothetical protein B7Y05_05305 [Polynucleobacter sp. 24-46-87]|jgi:hypothetical protein|nr:MAG: hypothetical protein B7Y55_00465 [Polynucleobacter sp. 35-46-207]OYZ39030.1 MAG: hypothetical protein B7Y22_00105 [Polynucleobacter sp. 16-46-70]OZA15077.1 MAG: hypothetical protein B7Y05_05305 [Polynucleobacter sp. 24-46-87]OZA42116.1 MAG: hypothetical protein B7X83_00335 [Polynucleobacter sp. 17-46-58]OZB49641.1 MAG: hypothetical protein B7X60_00400 [Polynucleobacter sp. 39-45-136]HQR83392.1 SRPBCC family protein [Polynucleobacter sp.]